jgi:hypothetical protein
MVLHHIMEKASCSTVMPARRNTLLRLPTRVVTPLVVVLGILQIHWPIRVLLVATNFGSCLRHIRVIATNGSFLIPSSPVLRKSANDR